MLEPFNFIYVTRANVTFTMTDRLPGFISHGLTYRAGDTTRGRFYDEGNFTSSSQGGAGGGGSAWSWRYLLQIQDTITNDLTEEFPKDSLMVIFKMQSEREIKESQTLLKDHGGA